MSSLKRKESSGGPARSSKTGASDTRPSKRPRSDSKSDRKHDRKTERKNDSKESKDRKDDKDDKVKTPSSAAFVSRLKEAEPTFTRGGANVLTPLEIKQIHSQAKNDALFDQAGTDDVDKNAAKKTRTRKSQRSDRKSKNGSAAPVKDGIRIESLNYKRLVIGSLVLGQVSEIGLYEMTVTLPNNLTGRVTITNVSDALTQRVEALAEDDNEKDDVDMDDAQDPAKGEISLANLFRVGQYLRVAILSTADETLEKKNKHQIELSLRPELTNIGLSSQDVVRNCTVMASVASVEDHGYVMNLGLEDSDTRGFLPFSELDDSIPGESVQPGAVLLCVVSANSANGKVAQLSTQHKKIGNIKHTAVDAVTINTFLPGTAADVIISEVTSRGLVGKILGHLDATADMIHSGAANNVNLEETYKVGTKIKARVVYNFPTEETPKIGISLLPHITSLEQRTVANEESEQPPKAPTDILPLSTVVEKCVVRRIEPNVGLWVDVGVDSVPGFVHISRVQEAKIDALYETSGAFKLDSVHRGRVLGYNAMDGTFLVTFAKNIIDQPFLRIEDIPVGAVVNGSIRRILIGENGVSGLTVDIAEGISGLVPEMHFADVKLQHPEKKFREGMKVKARVLSTNPDKRQFRLTLKKTLVNSDTPPVQSFDELSIGLQCLGTIINVIPIGAYVQFYGRLRGFLPVAEMSEAFIENPAEHFHAGQVVNVRVLKFDKELNKLVVSCKDPSAFDFEKQVALRDLKVASLVSGKVLQKAEDSVDVELAESGLKATLPAGHLTDRSTAKNQAALKRVHVGQTLSNLIVLDKHEGRRNITVSQKPSLIAASEDGKLLNSIEDARVGKSITGFVRNITDTCAFVQFANNIVALLPQALLPKEEQTLPSFGLHNFQTVTARLISVENGRLVLSTRPEKKDETATGELKDKDAKEGEAKQSTDKKLLVNPVDNALKSLDDVQIGVITTARVTGIKSTQLNVKLADNLTGRIDITEIFDDWNSVPDARHPLKKFSVDQKLKVRVLGLHDSNKLGYVPISAHRNHRFVLELSAKPSAVKGDAEHQEINIEKLQPGTQLIGFVNNYAPSSLWISLSPSVRGRLHGMEATNDLSLVTNLVGNFPIGMAMQVRVVKVDAARSRVDLSARPADGGDGLGWGDVKKNMVLAGKVTKVTERQIVIQLSQTVSGPVQLIDLVDDYDQAVTTSYFKNDIVRVAVVSVDGSNKRIRFSTRPSRVLSSTLPVEDAEIAGISDVKQGAIIRGFVRSVADKGLFVNLGGDIVAQVRISDLSDKFLKDWKAHFQVDQLVKGRVMSVDKDLKKVQLSLKASVVDEEYVPLLSLADYKEGQIVTGLVRKVEDFGAFIVIDGSSNVSGLCHRSEMAENRVVDAKKLYKEGDAVKAKILSIKRENSRMNLGLKPSYFADESDDDAMSVDADDDGAPLHDDDDSEDSDEDMQDVQDLLVSGTDNDLTVVDDASEDEDEDDGGLSAKGTGAGLSGGGFDWSGGAVDGNNADDDSDDEDGPALAPKAGKRKKTHAAGFDQTVRADGNGPQTVRDFEFRILEQPDSSANWLALMAFHLDVGELDKAREIAERAIKTINIRDGSERLNVWVAYVNMEITHGTDESTDAVFKRACQYNDAQSTFERVASIYIKLGKLEKADELFQTMTKKFGAQSPDIWFNYAHFLYNSMQEPERARSLLHRAVQALDQRSGIMLTARLAALEFRSSSGNPERGRTLFEGLLDRLPKRFDLWNQLLDLETRLYEEAAASGGSTADASVVRNAFEHASKVKALKARQAKTLFQRWAKWEEKNGDAKSRGRVSAKAKEWAAAAEKKKEEAAQDDDE